MWTVVHAKAYNVLIIRYAIDFIYFEVQTLCIKTCRHAGLVSFFYQFAEHLPTDVPQSKSKSLKFKF